MNREEDELLERMWVEMTFAPFRKKDVPALSAFKRMYSSRTKKATKNNELQDSSLGRMNGTDLTRV